MLDVCNDADDNCVNGTDEGLKVTFYKDADLDGYGNESTIQACTRPSGYAPVSGDCLEGDPAVNPGATEVCDASNVNEDCDSGADDADPQGNATGKVAIYADLDGDTYGAGASTGSECDPDANESINNTDCDDSASGGAR